jgi:hypothetical protein
MSKALQAAKMPGATAVAATELVLDCPGDKVQELNDLPIRSEGNNVVLLRDVGQAGTWEVGSVGH